MASICGSPSVAASTSFLAKPKSLSHRSSDGKGTSILSSLSTVSSRRSSSRIVSVLGSAESPLQPYGLVVSGLSRKAFGSPKKFERKYFDDSNMSYGAIEARANPPLMPAVITPGGPLDLTSVMLRNRIIFIGQPIYSQVAQQIISQLVTLATIDEDADILVYLNCPGGSLYSIMAVYDCMSWIKPKVGTVGFGVVASQAALLLAGGEKGMRYAMPNTRIMIHQPPSSCGGHVEDVRRQANEAVLSRHKVDMMFAAFTGQPLEKVQLYTERDRFLSPAEAMDFGFIDGILETEI